ncbi:MAG: hypothetical protein ACUVRM_10185, partial [Bacillota bacterium]
IPVWRTRGRLRKSHKQIRNYILCHLSAEYLYWQLTEFGRPSLAEEVEKLLLNAEENINMQ